ncbi:MAG TPA: hypothetical protein PLU72_18890 [Candidatus Ozemobacteraceae bacterium]|nr:hypothetical protein [Candidatus Ozemobacteraceae bacterium]HQG29303.1 hypothetical protein [Candidatus Ozemobacteraceae bacterium]
MRIGDVVWVVVLAGISGCLLVPQTHEAFIAATRAHPYLMGFAKVGVLATMGEWLARRISGGTWAAPTGLGWRFFVWGLFGVAFALVFDLFAAGTAAAIGKGLLPSFSEGFAADLSRAFWTSALMNLIFAPVFMAFHRVTDGYIDAGRGRLSGIAGVRLESVMSRIDWTGFVSFVLLRTIPLFWIPAHTVTFLLPAEYRVLVAAYLSIALGGILAFARLRQRPPETVRGTNA